MLSVASHNRSYDCLGHSLHTSICRSLLLVTFASPTARATSLSVPIALQLETTHPAQYYPWWHLRRSMVASLRSRAAWSVAIFSPHCSVKMTLSIRRKIVFIEAPNAKKGKSGLKDGVFVDPWGAPLQDRHLDEDGDRHHLLPPASTRACGHEPQKEGRRFWNVPALHSDHPDPQEQKRRAVASRN